MRVAVIGANGQLGTDLVNVFADRGEQVAALTHADVDISSLDQTRRVLSEVRPSIVINTAAAHHVETCETDPQRAYDINAIGARNLAAVAQTLGAKLAHVSTDYVFDGSKKSPYVEQDSPNPLNSYGRTKLAGEVFVQQIIEKHFIVRTSALYGKSPCRAKGGKNFVDLMLKLARERDEVRVVDDEIISPTPTIELASQIAELVRTSHYGLYHATTEEWCSWHEFAKEIFSITNAKVTLKVADPAEFPSKVRRPKYSVLENSNLKKMGLNCFSSWRRGLETYLSTINRLLQFN